MTFANSQPQAASYFAPPILFSHQSTENSVEQEQEQALFAKTCPISTLCSQPYALSIFQLLHQKVKSVAVEKGEKSIG